MTGLLLDEHVGTEASEQWLREAVRVWIAPDGSPFDVSPDWYELTGDCARVDIRRGRTSAIDVFEAGTVAIVVDNTSGDYHPLNPDSPLADSMRPGKQLWVECDDRHEYRDDWQRPDDSTDIGRLDSGELWWQAVGTWEISNYELGLAAAGSIGGTSRGVSVVDVGEGDGFVEFVVGSVAVDGMGAVFRWSNDRNGWYIKRDAASSRWQVCKLIDNSETVVTNVSAATAAGTKVRVDFAGDRVGPVTVDGVEVAASTATDDEFAFCSQIGLFADGALTTARWGPFRAGVVQRTLARMWVDYTNGWRLGEDPLDRHATATIRGVDILAMVATVDTAEVSPAVGAAELSGARVNRVLDLTSVPDAWRDIDLGLYTLASTTHGENALSEIRTATLSEGGALMARANGRIWFGDRDSGIDRERTNGPRFTLSDTAPSDDDDWTPAAASRGTVYWFDPAYIEDAAGDPIEADEAIETLTPAVDFLGLGEATVAADDPTATRPTYRAGSNGIGPHAETTANTDRISTDDAALSGITGPYSVAALCRVDDWSVSYSQWWSADGDAELIAPNADASGNTSVWDGTTNHATAAYNGANFDGQWILVVVHRDPVDGSGYLEVGGRRYVNFSAGSTSTPTQFHMLNHHNLAAQQRAGDASGALFWIVEGEFTETEVRRAYRWAAHNYAAAGMGADPVPFGHPVDWEDFAGRIRNKILLSADGLTDVEDDDATSQTNFGIHSLRRSGLKLDTQGDLDSLATRLLNEWADPTAGPAVTTTVAHDGGVRYSAATRTELRDRHYIQYRPQGFADARIASAIADETVHSIVFDAGWETAWRYIPADRFSFGDATSYLVLDHPQLGKLNENAVS